MAADGVWTRTWQGILSYKCDGLCQAAPLYWDTDKYCEAFSKTGFISTLILLYFSVLDERTILENLQARYSYDQIYVSWIIDH